MSAPKYFGQRFPSHQADTLYISSNTPDSFYPLYLKMKYASPVLLGHNGFRQTGNDPNTIHSPPRNLKFNQKQDGSHTKHTIPFLFERYSALYNCFANNILGSSPLYCLNFKSIPAFSMPNNRYYQFFLFHLFNQLSRW